MGYDKSVVTMCCTHGTAHSCTFAHLPWESRLFWLRLGYIPASCRVGGGVTSTSVSWRFREVMDVMRCLFGNWSRSRYSFSGPRRILLHTSVFSKPKNSERPKRAPKSSKGRRTSGPIGFVSVLVRFLSDCFRYSDKMVLECCVDYFWPDSSSEKQHHQSIPLNETKPYALSDFT